MPTNIVKPLQWWDYNRDDPLADGLRAYWPLWEGAGSVARSLAGPSTLHGQITGAEYKTSDRGTILNFGADTELSAHGNIDITGEAITIMVSCRRRGAQTSNGARILHQQSGAGSDDWYLAFDDTGRIRFRLRLAGSPQEVSTAPSIADLTWVVCHGTYDGAKMRIYYDGVEVGNVARTGNITNTGEGGAIGRHLSSSVRDFIGDVDVAAVWDRLLLPEEIQECYNSPYRLITPGSTPVRVAEAPPAGGTVNPLSMGAVNLLAGKLAA